MESSQSNFNLRSPGSYIVRSYLITTVQTLKNINLNYLLIILFILFFTGAECSQLHKNRRGFCFARKFGMVLLPDGRIPSFERYTYKP